MKKFFTILLSALIVLAMSATAFAADDFQIRVFSGDSGSFIDGDAAVHTEKAGYGMNASFEINVNVNNDKYYVKGIKPAGKDTREKIGVANGGIVSVGVKKDADYVVDYGAKEAAKAYTVKFLDNDGKQLAPDRVQYGDAGDKIIVSSLYINGYVPAAYNLAKTLSEDESQNVFTFYYKKGSNNNGEVIVINGGNGGNGGVAPANGVAVDGDGANVEEKNNAPRELVDLDVEEAPKANIDLNEQEDAGMSMIAKVAISGGAVVIAAAAIWLFLRKRREEAE